MGLFRKLRDKGVGRWLLHYMATSLRRRPRRPGEETHVLLCLADHYEPKSNNAPPELARQRVCNWVEHYPRLFGRFRDSDGRPPRHTFFYPPEEYEPAYLDALTELCQAGFGEVEVHIHHRHDTAESLRDKLAAFRDLLAGRHHQLARDRHTGELAYGFVHGNWSLCNSRPDGDWCGVNDELTVLRQTGCYADFTLPSMPSPTQTAKINSLYYARSSPDRPRGHDRGVDVGTGPAPEGSLLLIQGPLLLDWGNRKWGILPRPENAADAAAARFVDEGAGAGTLAPRLVFCKIARARRPGGEPDRAPGRRDGSLSRRIGRTGRAGSAVPLPLRHGPRDGQPGGGRRGRLAGTGRRRPGLPSRLERPNRIFAGASTFVGFQPRRGDSQ
jgi:hypothetical protein